MRANIPPRPVVLVALAILAAALHVAAASAQSSIDLGDLSGAYGTNLFSQSEYPAHGLFTTELPPEVQAVDEIRLVLSGAVDAGLMVCADPITGEPDTLSFVPGLSVFLWVDDPSEFFHATIAVEHGEFENAVAAFAPCCGLDAPGLADLIGSQVHGDFFLDGVLPLPCTSGGIDPLVVITSAHLDVYGPVPDEQTSWGATKALFR